MKRLLIFTGLLILAGSAFADNDSVTLVTGVDSDGDITGWWDLDSNGSTAVFINGEGLSSKTKSASYNMFSNMIKVLNGGRGDGRSTSLAFSLDDYLLRNYVSVRRFDYLSNYTNTQLRALGGKVYGLSLDVQAMDYTLTEALPEEYCRGKVRVLWENSLPGIPVNCTGTLFQYTADDYGRYINIYSIPRLNQLPEYTENPTLSWSYGIDTHGVTNQDCYPYGNVTYPFKTGTYFKVFRDGIHVGGCHACRTYTDTTGTPGNHNYTIKVSVGGVTSQESNRVQTTII